MTDHHQSISLDRLVQSRVNVPQTAQTHGIKKPMTSIAAHGLRQTLNVQDEPLPWPAIHNRIAHALDAKPPSHLSHMRHMR